MQGTSVTQQIFPNKSESVKGKESQIQEMMDDKKVKVIENFASSNETANEVQERGKGFVLIYLDR